MAKTNVKTVATPITIFSIVDDGSGNICVEFNKEKVVEFKEFINQVFQDRKYKNDGQVDAQIPFAHRPPMYPDGMNQMATAMPFPNAPHNPMQPPYHAAPPYNAMMEGIREDIKNEAIADFGMPPMPPTPPELDTMSVPMDYLTNPPIVNPAFAPAPPANYADHAAAPAMTPPPMAEMSNAAAAAMPPMPSPPAYAMPTEAPAMPPMPPTEPSADISGVAAPTPAA